MSELHDKIHRNISKHFKIERFLLECNKLMDGIYLEEITEDHNLSWSIKFQAKLTCLYANESLWSPSTKFYDVVIKAGQKYLGIKGMEDFGWNNTHTIFWIEKEKIK
jgi:hypothetical protein